MKKVLTAIVTFIFSICLVAASVATVSAASVKKVTGLKADIAPLEITLSWKKASGAKTYEVQQQSGKKWKTIKTTKSTSLTVKKLKSGTNYQFRVRAVNGKKKSAYVTVKAKTGVAKITSVKASSTGLKTAKLTWAKGKVTGYEVQVLQSNKKWKTVKKITKSSTTSLNLSGLIPGAKNSVRIRGYVKGAIKTYYGSYTTVSVTTAVAPMKTVSVKSTTDKAATISWTKVSGVSGYQVQKYQSGKWVDVNKAVKNSVTQLTVSGLPSFTSNQIRIRAYQKDGKKTFYNGWKTVKATTKMGTISKVTYSSLTATSVKVSWTAAVGATNYRVYVNGAKKADVNTLSAVLKLNAATAYKVQVVPYKGSSTGSYSPAVNFTTPCAQVTGVKATAVSESAITLAWSKVAGATGYQLQYYKNGAWSSNISVSALSYQAKDLEANSAYIFRVRAINKNGSTTQYGAYSVYVTAKTTGLGSFTENTVSWSAVSGAASYELSYYDNSTSSWKIAAEDLTATSYTNEEICADTTRLFRVKAYDSADKLIYTSNTASANISNVSFSISDNFISASWSKTAGASSYEVRIKSVGMTDSGATVIKATNSNRSVKSSRLAPGNVYEATIAAINGGKATDLAKFTLKASDFVVDNSDKSKTDQLLYLAEAFNRSKFDNSSWVTLYSTPYSLNEVHYMDFGIQGVADRPLLRTAAHGLLAAFLGSSLEGEYEYEDGFLKCYDAKAIDSVMKAMDPESSESISKQENGGIPRSYIFQNGELKGATQYKIGDFMNINGDKSALAYLYNSGNVSAWKNGFSKVETTPRQGGGYVIKATLKQETNPNYHSGFISSTPPTSIDLGDLGRTQIDSWIGETTIEAEIDSNCRLVKYAIDSPNKYNMNVVLSLSGDVSDLDGDDDAVAGFVNTLIKALGKLVFEMNLEAEGQQRCVYEFTTRIK